MLELCFPHDCTVHFLRAKTTVLNGCLLNELKSEKFNTHKYFPSMALS